MLRLSDFYHLPTLAPIFRQIVADGPGLTVVAGLEPVRASLGVDRPGTVSGGRKTVFRILVGEILAENPDASYCVIASDNNLIRLPPGSNRRAVWRSTSSPEECARILSQQTDRDIVILEILDATTAVVALEASLRGTRVLAQLDSVYRGPQAARLLQNWGAAEDPLRALRWMVSVQRLPALCERCRRDMLPEEVLAALHDRIPTKDKYYAAAGCTECDDSGYLGDVLVFDIFRAEHGISSGASSPELHEYALALAAAGRVALDDALQLEASQLQRLYEQLRAHDTLLAETKLHFERKVIELETSKNVLEQRTRALVLLQELGQTLSATVGLDELGPRICDQVRELCGAERSVLYLRRDPLTAEVVAAAGWETAPSGVRLTATDVFRPDDVREPIPYHWWPPGITPPDEAVALAVRAGLYVPLIAESELVGALIVVTTIKPKFSTAEIALLQTFATQAALAIQRDRYITQLAHTQRIERELELARELQQSVLPRFFPSVQGLTFSARSEPAREVGGDFYDVIALGQGAIGIAIGDVSGKGMAAALYMALTRSLLLAEARRDLSPRNVLLNVDGLLKEIGEPGMFVTVFYGVVDLQTRRLTYARAGHDRPLLIRGGEVLELSGRGTFLGLLESGSLNLSEESMLLEAGDRLILYTDGLIDVELADNRLFDHAGLRHLVAAYAPSAAHELCAALFTDVKALQGDRDQFDDMTALVMVVQSD